ncbi:MAG: hypothetical protein LBQ82_08260, partial [Treponema sp.]|nr:hypothetical protein [Treponema sp.]
MKITVFAVCFILLTLLFTVEIYSEEIAADDEERVEIAPANQTLFIFSEGVTISWLTRIIKQTERSNFVLEDFLIGLYFRTEMVHFDLFKPMIRAAAYYPMKSTFNDFPQEQNTPLHFGADLTAGLKFEIVDLNYIRVNVGPALHFFYLNSDRWNYFNMGAAAFAGIEVPVAERWTVLLNGFASFDNGNLGGNRLMEPFDITYQYQIDIGVRYSKKHTNKVFIFPLNLKSES